MFDRRLLLNFDFSLLFIVFILSACGIVNLYSISSSLWEKSSIYFYKQIYWTILGILMVFFVITFNYINLIRYAYYIHGISIFLLLLVLFTGQTKFGSQRWLSLGPFSIQPSEFAKITFILVLSKFFTENTTYKPYGFFDLIIPISFLLITSAFIYAQPDLGTAGIIILLFISLSFFVRIKRSLILFVGISLFFITPVFWNILKEYQKQRILMFFNPNLDPLHAGYQVIQSKIAIGSGGFWGKGFMLGTQSQLRFLPEQHTDFVFSVWAEEWGMIGCLFVLFFFLLLLYKGITISMQSKNKAGSFLAIGIVIFFFLHIIINIGMTLGLFPVVGVPLPFFSYGGSSMMTSMICTGLLLNINMRKFKY